MQHPYTKEGFSVRELALVKWFVRQSYTTPRGEPLPDSAVNAWAEAIYRRLTPPLKYMPRSER